MQKLRNYFFIRVWDRVSSKIKWLLALSALLFAIFLPFASSLHFQKAMIDGLQSSLSYSEAQMALLQLKALLPRHERLLQRILQGETALKSQLLSLQATMGNLIKSLAGWQSQTARQADQQELLATNRAITEMTRDWDGLIKEAFQQPSKLSQLQNESFAETLEELAVQFKDWPLLSQQPHAALFVHDLLTFSLPRFNFLISSILQNLSAENFKLYPSSKDFFDYLLKRLQEDLKFNEKEMALFFNKEEAYLQIDNLEKERLKRLWQSFNSSLRGLIESVELIVGNSQEPSRQELISVIAQGENTEKALFAFRIEATKAFESLVQTRLHHSKSFYLFSIALPLSLLFFSAYLFFVLFIDFYVPFAALCSSVKRFAQGNLEERVEWRRKDGLGVLGKTLNSLADNFKSTLEQLHRVGIQLTTSTTEIAAAAKQQEVTVLEQESTTKEIAVTAGEISATAKDFAQTMNKISLAAEQTSSLATQGKEGLTKMESIMHQMVDASTTIASRLAVMNEKANGITSVVTTIAKVADQTNLLSLNASIEAEKAGEMGRSFAVIAREIRRLADQVAGATVDIEMMVNEMLSVVTSGVMGVDKFSEEIQGGVSEATNISGVFSQIIEQVQELTGSFEVINERAQNQMLGAEQINTAINQLSEVAQQTAESIRQFQNAIHQLNMAAKEMQTSAAKMRTVAGS